jgi:predicted O-methyltransferase YrrM
MSLNAVRDAYLKRAVQRLREGATTVGREQILGARAADLRFRFERDARTTAMRELAECKDGPDFFRFTQRHLPGALFYPPGASQNEGEIFSMLAFAADREPRTVVEIGTQTGGTTFLLASMLPSVTALVGLDLFVRNQPRLRAFTRPGIDLHFISANSSLPSTQIALERALSGRTIDLLFIDGDHSFRGSASDFRTYRRLVTPGGLVAFHDIVPDNTLRSGAESLAWAGEVPVLWDLLRGQYKSHEFVDSWEQEARGIGLLEYDPAVDPQLAPSRASASPH